MSSRKVRAVPRALVASRVWILAGFVGLAGGIACGVVTTGPSATTTASFDAGVGGGSSSGGIGNVGGSCQPSNVQTFVPGPYQPAVSPSDACLDGDAGGGLWDEFYDACLGPEKTNDACTAFKQVPSNAACAACVLTPNTAAQLGPILSYGEFVGGNIAGCIEIAAGDLPCAKAVQGLSDCETAACQANCPVTDSTSLMTWMTCVQQADQGGCQSWFNMASDCRAAEADAGLGQACADSAFKDFYDDVVPLFCGQVAVDASGGPVFDAGASDAAAPAADAAEDQSAPDAGSD